MNPWTTRISQIINLIISADVTNMTVGASGLWLGTRQELVVGVPVKILKAVETFFHSVYSTCPYQSS